MQDRQYFGGADLVRFAAALLVMSFHLGWAYWTPGNHARAFLGPFANQDGEPFPIWFGWVGVEAFFVISGLVIANSAMNKSPVAFVKSRIYRLYPTAWICATLSALILIALGRADHLVHRYVNSILLYPLGGWVSGVYWTLGVEIVFYAMVVLWRLALPQASLRGLAVVLLVWCGAYIGLRELGIIHLVLRIERVLLLPYGLFFAVGILLWLNASERRRRIDWLLLALCVGFGAFSFRNGRPGPDHTSLDAPLLVAIWSASVLAIWFSTTRWGSLSGASTRTRKIVRMIGLMTYPIYLVHPEAGTAWIRICGGMGVPALPAVLSAELFVIALSIGIVALESPLRRWLKAIVEGAETAFFKAPS